MDRTRGRGEHFGRYTGRYAVLGYDPANEGGEWLSQDGKRRRRLTDGTFNNTGDYAGPETFDNNPPDITTHKFKAMSTDEKLVTLFELMNNVSSINARVTSTERNIETIN